MIGAVYPAGLAGWAASGWSWQVGFLGGETGVCRVGRVHRENYYLRMGNWASRFPCLTAMLSLSLVSLCCSKGGKLSPWEEAEAVVLDY